MAVLEERIALMVRLGKYFSDKPPAWQEAVTEAERQNGWFTPDFTQMAAQVISSFYLQEDRLRNWLNQYPDITTHDITATRPQVGIVMAGNIPLVGFHDFLCVYLSGMRVKLKLSSKDTVLWEHILKVLQEWDSNFPHQVNIGDMLKNCDAYIATGSNNSARYFEQYFQKYPHIIRKNRSSVAILDGNESAEELEALADDVCTYFGLGCRNVTKIWLPESYSFETLLPAFDKYKQHIHHNKYKNNYDYQLALFLLNKMEYMTNGSILLAPSESIYAPISVLHYGFYTDKTQLLQQLATDDNIQCITVKDTKTIMPGDESSHIKTFGQSQYPQLDDYADGVDTLQFLLQLNSSRQ